jgi:hypothetical protein
MAPTRDNLTSKNKPTLFSTDYSKTVKSPQPSGDEKLKKSTVLLYSPSKNKVDYTKRPEMPELKSSPINETARRKSKKGMKNKESL